MTEAGFKIFKLGTYKLDVNWEEQWEEQILYEASYFMQKLSS